MHPSWMYLIMMVIWSIMIVHATKVSSSSILLNDDYCDTEDGSDEPLTSACSGITSKQYKCIGDFEKSIPYSHVNDGICDCCDGADESNEITHCDNICYNTYKEIQEAVLAKYNIVKGGLEKKRHYESIVMQRVKTEAKKYERYIEDITKIKVFIRRIKTELQREERLERVLRFKLIRRRQYQCRAGVEEQCDLFYPEYFYDSELLDEGVQDSYEMDKKRLLIDSSIIDRGLAHAASLEGYDRVIHAVCPYKLLLPDDTVLIWETVGAYIDYMNTTSGRASVKPNPTQIRRNTLLGPYLETGDIGKQLFALHAADAFGLVLAPFTVTIRLVIYGMHALATYAYSSVQANNTISRTINKALISTDNIFHSDEYKSFQRALNPYRYSAITTALDTMHPYIHPILFIWNNIYSAPDLYIDIWYYKKEHQLPHKRQACLLRQGLSSAEKELLILESNVKAFDDMVHSGKGGKWVSREMQFEIKGKCVSMEDGKYTYHFCFYESIRQNDVLIGTYRNPDEIATSTTAATTTETSPVIKPKPLKIQILEWISYLLGTSKIKAKSASVSDGVDVFDRGDSCYIGGKLIPRSAYVSYSCTADLIILSVEETEICKYSVKVGSPLVCTDEEEKQLMSQLEKLGVFS